MGISDNNRGFAPNPALGSQVVATLAYGGAKLEGVRGMHPPVDVHRSNRS